VASPIRPPQRVQGRVPEDEDGHRWRGHFADHTKLNVVVNQLADKFGVRLPDKPKSTQQN
jgi:hypothetical protein